MKNLASSLIFLLLLYSCRGQTPDEADNMLIGGPCQDCEAVLDYKLVTPNLKSVDTLPGYSQYRPQLEISGTVFKPDGKTPAEDVILYIYHTSRDSIYDPSLSPVGWEKRHGQHRGWIKTDDTGQYTFYSFRPTPYPRAQESEHIHIYIKEPSKNPYWIDSYMFVDDPTLKKEDIESQKQRGGSGLINIIEQNGILICKRDIILGLNIPNYKR